MHVKCLHLYATAFILINFPFLVLQSYSQYIVSLMARLCAPGRDDKIRELTGLRDLIPLYKGIFEVFNRQILFSLFIVFFHYIPDFHL